MKAMTRTTATETTDRRTTSGPDSPWDADVPPSTGLVSSLPVLLLAACDAEAEIVSGNHVISVCLSVCLSLSLSLSLSLCRNERACRVGDGWMLTV